MKNSVSIIMYHYVRDLKYGKFQNIKGLDIELFIEQIDYLNRHYSIITMEELIYSVENNSQLPAKSALLTFDDGYLDHYEYVLPVLSKYKKQGSFYPPAKAVLGSEVLEVNKIHFILATIQNKKVLVDEILNKLNEYRQEYNLESNDEYYKRYAVASRFDIKEVMFIKHMLQVVLPEKLRIAICNYLFNKYVTNDESSFCRELYMDVAQIKNLKDQGMHIGSHGNNHCWLESLSKEKQEIEIDKSLEFLQLIGINLDQWTMSYPYGSYNADTVNIVNKKGCKLALTAKIDIADLNQNRKFELPRLDTNDIPKMANASTNSWYDLA